MNNKDCSASMNDIICMISTDKKKSYFLVVASKMPQNPIGELKVLYPHRCFIDGYYLADEDTSLYRHIKDEWNNYDKSLSGIWHHPRFPENLEEIRRNSGFAFDVPNWCSAEWQDRVESNN